MKFNLETISLCLIEYKQNMMHFCSALFVVCIIMLIKLLGSI